MFESNTEALADVQAAPVPYRAHTVEILIFTAASLVLFISVYLLFFDGQIAI